MSEDKCKQSVYMRRDLLARAQEICAREDRSLSWVVQKCMELAIEDVAGGVWRGNPQRKEPQGLQEVRRERGSELRQEPAKPAQKGAGVEVHSQEQEQGESEGRDHSMLDMVDMWSRPTI